MAQAPGSVSASEHAARANAALKAGHPEKAIPEFQALVTMEPGNVDAQANLGVLLYFQNDYKQALSPLRTALQSSGAMNAIQAGKLHALLGQAEAALGQADAAKLDLGIALSGLAGDSKEAKLRKDVGLKLVEVDTATDDLGGAATALQTLQAVAPDDPEVLYAGYRVYSDLAGQSLLNLSLNAPASGRMQQAIAHELERVRDYPASIVTLRKAIALEPHLPGIHYELGELLRVSDSTSERAQAEAEYTLALKQNANDTMSLTRLGDIHADRNDMAGAEKSYQKALAIQPSNADAALGMARVLSEGGQDEKALPLLLGVIAADPGNMLAHYRLSALYRKLHRPEDAKRELTAYQKIKDLKEKLRETYRGMRLATPGGPDANEAGMGSANKNGAKP
ncbi:MAG TPA: tetratricopeptide repeat protein [Acidobacteriaceae bacterium]